MRQFQSLFPAMADPDPLTRSRPPGGSSRLTDVSLRGLFDPLASVCQRRVLAMAMHPGLRFRSAAVATETEPGSAAARLTPSTEPVGDNLAPATKRLPDGWLVGALAVTVLALVLRLTGVSFGLPYHYHWDEPTIMNRVIRMGGGDLNPHFFYYPTLLMYVLLAAQGALYVVGRALHYFPSADAFATAYLTDSTASYLVGRGLVACLGAASVFLTFVIGRRFLSAPAGLIGALLLAVSPVHIGSSHFVTNDVPMVFFALLAYVFLWDVYARGRPRDYVLSGLVIGLGTATKYLPVVLLVSLAAAHAFRLVNESGGWRSVGRNWLLLVAAGLAAFMAFSIASPYVLLDWRSALHDYGVQAALSSAAGCRNCPPNAVTYLSQTMPWAIGWPAYLLGLVGLASLAWTVGERRRRALLLASFPVILFVMVGSERQPWPRWLVPVAPFASLSAGAVLVAVADRFRGVWSLPDMHTIRLPRWSGAALATTAVVLIVFPPAVASARFDLSLLNADPRTQAAAWFQSSVPDGTAVAVQPMLDRYFYTVPTMTDSQLNALESWIPASKPALREAVDEHYHSQPLYHQVPFTYDVQALRAQGVRYVVLSSAHYHNIDPPTEDRFYADLAQRGELVARFTPPVTLPDANQYPVSMPTITVYLLTH